MKEDVPVLLILAKKDYVAKSEIQRSNTVPWVKGKLRIEEVESGHWVMMEREEVVNGLLREVGKEVEER